jgi:hypothetical protein
MDANKVAALFISYVNEDDRWRNMIGWVPIHQHVRVGPSESRAAPGIVERHGNHIVISKRFCMLIGGLLLCLLGAASFFLVGSVSSRRGFAIPGTLIAVGFVTLILSGSTDD